MRNPVILIAAVASCVFLHFCQSATAQKSQSVTPAANGNVIYLYDMLPTQIDDDSLPERQQKYQQNIDENWRIGSIKVGQKLYPKSVSIGRKIDESGSVSFDIAGYDYFVADLVTLKARREGSSLTGVFVVSGNGRRLLPSIPNEQQLKTPYHIKVSMKEIEKLTIRFDGAGAFASDVWWANARLIKGQVPPETDSDVPPVRPVGGSASAQVENGSKVLRLDPEKLKELAAQLKADIADDPEYSKSKPTVAIAAFKLISKPGEELAGANAESIRESLSTALIRTKAFDLVERGQLDKALKELKIGLGDTFDSTMAQKLGRLINARTVLIGSLSDQGTYAIINVRLIDTETGRVRIAASVELRQ